MALRCTNNWRAIESGEEKFRDAAEYLAEAQKFGASQRQSATDPRLVDEKSRLNVRSITQGR